METKKAFVAKKVTRICLAVLLVFACLSFFVFVWSLWYHQQNLYYYLPEVGMEVRKTGLSAANFLSPMLFLVFALLALLTAIVAAIWKKIEKT